tara:strand:- start:159 stop:1487 length:1329 start_codon:yes stop_codon:yes gene_type:complete
MGSMFSSGNTNNLAKVNKNNISTQEFIDYLNSTGIPQETIRENLDQNIIEELLSNLISTTILNLEIDDLNLIFSKNSLSQKIKKNKNFLDENGNFQRIKYEKFLLENNQSAPQFEKRLKERELQKNLFDYIGAGTVSPKFLVNKLYEEENKKLEIEFINLKNFYKKEEEFTVDELKNFINENKDKLKIEYLDFNYVIINPKNLGTNEFNQSFFDKIDQIEIDIANNIQFKDIIKKMDIIPIVKTNLKFSNDISEIEKKIFELKQNNIDIFEIGDDYVMYEIQNIYKKEPDINDPQTKNELVRLISQKNKFEYNQKLLKKINEKKFNDNDFLEFGKGYIKKLKLNSIRDNKKFDINSIKVLYSLPINSVTLINDEENNIYLAKVKKFENKKIENQSDKTKTYIDKLNSNIKNDMLKSYDLYLNDKYNVVLNQKTVERVKNFFQ